MRGSGRRKRERGFTLIETLVTLTVMLPVVLGLYSLVDSSSRLSKQEANVSQAVTVSGKTYLVPLYFVGRVNADAAGSWYTYAVSGGVATFTFNMNPSDAGAKVFNATAAGAPSLQNPFVCGALDDILFFVDEGTAAVSGDTHPALAMATYDPSTGHYDIQSLVDEVEDFQIAYGVDGADASTVDGGADPVAVNVTAANKDEWVGNVAGEVDASLGTPAAAVPRTGAVSA